jgi:hypothetical protein
MNDSVYIRLSRNNSATLCVEIYFTIGQLLYEVRAVHTVAYVRTLEGTGVM